MIMSTTDTSMYMSLSDVKFVRACVSDTERERARVCAIYSILLDMSLKKENKNKKQFTFQSYL